MVVLPSAYGDVVATWVAGLPNSGSPSGPSTSPQAFTTTTTTTDAAPAEPRAMPRPPGSCRSRHLPVEAPVPAPTGPRTNSSPPSAARTARRPLTASGGAPATVPSKIDIPTTIGTGPSGVGKPAPS